MSTRTRPNGCCDIPINPVPLSDRDRLVGMLKALADPTRLEVFRLVAAQEAAICACDVVDRFQVSQPTISHHMKVLAEAGLIRVSRRGVWAYYEVDRKTLASLEETLESFSPPVLAEAS